jgi:Domain of unknown function (DUF5658)
LNQLLLHYAYLQVLDFLTTVAFMINGVKEGNPLVRLAMSVSPNPMSALLTVKLAAVALGILCFCTGRERLLSRINIVFAVLVAWNLVALIVSSAEFHT